MLKTRNTPDVLAVYIAFLYTNQRGEGAIGINAMAESVYT
jgi:hypothetical protein